jgi:hypothetical protein
VCVQVLAAPDYRQGGWVHLVYAIECLDGNTTVVARARIAGDHLTQANSVIEGRETSGPMPGFPLSAVKLTDPRSNRRRL